MKGNDRNNIPAAAPRSGPWPAALNSLHINMNDIYVVGVCI